jgi:probable HAF family extracellular repeat protein
MLDSKPLEFAEVSRSDLSTATTSGERYASGLESIPLSASSKSSAPLFYGNDNDVITAIDGNQIIYAGDGNNIILTGSDRDLLYAGSGNDIINLGDGNNIVNAAGGNNRVLTGAGNDLVFVGNGSNVVYTSAGNDIIYAGTGRNLISAGTGNDTVLFGSGVNQLILSGGEGSVTVYGFKPSSDRLRLGGDIAAESLKFETEGNNTLVMSGSDLLATLKDATVSVKSLVPAGTPLFSYEVVDLGAPSTYPNSTTVAGNVINDRGQIAGRASTGIPSASASPTTPVNVPFIWENGSIKLLTLTGEKIGGPDGGTTITMPGRGGLINGINDQGVIVGAGDQPYPTGAGDRGLKWTELDDGTYSLTINQYEGVTAGTPTGSSFGTGPYAAESYYFDINNSGQIAGRNIYDGDDHSRAIYLDANGNKFDLPDIGGDTATARGINNLGQIVGLVDGDGVNDITVNTTVVWEQDATGQYTLKNLGTFGYDQSSGRDINDVGQIIGTVTSGTGTTAITQGFIYEDGEIALLGGFGGTTESANGINQFGQVVGSAQNVGKQNRAFVWNDGTIFDLNNSVSNPAALSVNGSAVTLTSATGINNFGDIVANGSYTYKDAAGTTQTGTRAYLLKAVV